MEAEREAGYFLARVIVLGILLMAVSSGSWIFVQARRASEEDGYRMQAAYLAQMQFAAAEEMMYDGRDLPEELPWLGDTDDLQLGEASFTVRTASDACPEGRVMHVNVSWERDELKGSLDFERVLVRHGAK